MDEVTNLKACLNDMVGISALPAMWNGEQPLQIIVSLADVLIRVVCPDFVYIRLKLQTGEPIETVRFSPSADFNPKDGFDKVLREWLSNDSDERSSWIRNDDGIRFSVATLGLGLRPQVGKIIVGSRIAGFPNKTERLLLNTAANQAGAALQKFHQFEKPELLPAQSSEFRKRYALLTRREREVLPYMISGFLSKQVAAKLGTSEITIRVHRRQVMRKMQARSLAELIRMADKLGVTGETHI